VNKSWAVVNLVVDGRFIGRFDWDRAWRKIAVVRLSPGEKVFMCIMCGAYEVVRILVK